MADVASLLKEIPEFPDYISLEQHLGTIVGSSIIFIGALYYLNQPDRKHKHEAHPPKKLSLLEHIFGIILLVSVSANVAYKYLLGPKYLSYMLYPCHVMSCCLVYVLYSKNHKRAATVWNIVVFYTHFTFLALVSPDTSDLFFFMQVPVFWTQHYALLLLPMVMIITNRYPLQRPTFAASFYWYVSAVIIVSMFCFLVHLPVSIILGVNVNYVYWPPPGHIDNSPLSGPLYHLKMFGVVALLSWITGFPLVWALKLVRKLLIKLGLVQEDSLTGKAKNTVMKIKKVK